MTFFRESDAVSGKYAKAFAIINGRKEELFYAKSLESTIEKNKVDVPVLGKVNTPKRSTGWSGTGSMTVYYVTSAFRLLMHRYIKTGQDFWFDLQVTNEDPSSSTGKQTVVLINCNIDSITAAQFDTSSDDMLEEEIPFTFSDYDLLDKFNTITGV
ncbi:phage tail tube protein [Paenibacillus sp. L3-i20]|uniref:phage tail tube protein n=1 Tax=Paenibacillus sp. L3-i20 TaxID=2905833 RepID=UPI001EDE3DD9|nr:phage tail tube protein [Paenibacillus sp. L3-i20]GKU79857.1 phage portal protein [Paenibacillus sp. L3-i20]